MNKSLKLYEFGEFRLDLERNLLLHQEETVPLTHKALETLIFLVENSGRVVEKDEILQRVWQDTFVEEGSLTRNISTLRKALGEEPGSNKYIETIPRRGYRFVARVQEITNGNGNSAINGFVQTDELSEAETIHNGNGVEPKDNKDGSFETKPQIKAHQVQNNSQNLSFQKIIFLSLIGLLFISLVIIFFALPNQSKSNQNINSANITQELKFTKLTNIGKASEAVISPDGKYVVYVSDDIGKQSLWVKQVATGSTVQIINPGEVTYQGLAFSSDSDFVYYNLWDRKSVGVIYRIPTLGGVSTKIIHDCMPNISISPDGGKIAFIRGYAVKNEQGLIIADTNGGNERVISSSANWRALPAWSPDGRKIAFAMGIFNPKEQGYISIREFNFDTNQEREITPKNWLGIGGLVWLKDGKTLIFNGAEENQQPFQLWKIDYASGEVQKVTNDSNGFYGINSITSDFGTAIAVQEDAFINIWTASVSDLTKANKITSGKYEGIFLNSTPDNKIIYSSRASGNLDLWIMEKDGSNKRQLTSDKEVEFVPSVSHDGRYVLFTGNHTKTPHVWRMDIDGRNLKQLTDEDGGWCPIASPVDGWFIYLSAKGGKENLWKMPVEGGEPVRLTKLSTYNPAISPDGKMLAYSIWNENVEPQRFEHEIISLENGRKIQSFEMPSTAFRSSGNTLFRWMPDGKGLSFIDNRDGASNISYVPLDGGQPVQLTNFNDSLIFWFEWSRDGQQLVMTRGVILNDVVLIENLQNLQQ